MVFDFFLKPRNVLVAICVGYLAAILATFGDYGVNPDEGVHIANGEAVVDWYASGFESRALFTWTNIWAYGGAFDVLCHFAVRVSPFTVYETRHLVTTLTGLVGVIGVYVLGCRIGSPWTGVLAAALLILTPRYYGHAFFNHKDIPFAVGYVWSVALILRCYASWPKLRAKTLIACGLAIGFTLGLRVGGAILFCTLGVACLHALYGLRASGRLTRGSLSTVAGSCAAVFAVAYVVMLLAWPWAQLGPISRPLRALLEFASFPVVIPVFFEGTWLASNEVPWHYAAKWLVLTLPEVVLVGSLVGIAAAVTTYLDDRDRGFPACLATFALLFPLAYAAVKGVPFSNGMRHVLFTLPLTAVLAAHGLLYMHGRWPQAGRVKVAVATIVATVMVWDLIDYHPNQYVYFNRLLAGGIEDASIQYETDYYANAYEAGIDWVLENADGPATVATPAGIVLDADVTRALPAQADYYLGRTYMAEHLDVPGEAVHTIGVGGVELLRIVKPSREPIPDEAPDPGMASFFYLRRAQHLEAAGDVAAALEALQTAVRSRPAIKGAQSALARLLFEGEAWAEAASAYERLLEMEPGQDQNLVRLGAAYHNLGEFDRAEAAYLQALAVRPDQYQAHYQLGAAYAATGRLDQAVDVFERVIDLYPKFPQAKLSLVRTLFAVGRTDAAVALSKRVVAEHPDMTEVHVYLINHHLETQNLDGAVDAIRNALTASPDSGRLWYALARVLRTKGDLDSAAASAARAIPLDAPYPELKSEVIQIATALADRDPAGARRLLGQMLDAHPDDGEVRAAIAVIVAKGGTE